MNVALLRAINVGGHEPVSMADLRAFFEKLGFSDVKTLLASGNIVFRGRATETLLEQEAKKRMGLQTDFFLRSTEQWQAIVDGNPFAREAKNDPGRLVVAVFKGRGTPFEWAGPEIVRADDTNAYIYYPNGQGRSKLTTAVLDKNFGTRCTARNWNTVLKILNAVTSS